MELSDLFRKFAAKKRRKEFDMVFLGIIGITLIIIGVMALMSNEKPKPRKPKKKVHSPWDKDPFFGTPLEKF